MKPAILGLLLTSLIYSCAPLHAIEEKSPPPAKSAVPELHLATNEWPPYASEKIAGGGICTEIITAIVHEMGMKPVYTFYPWKRAMHVVKQGKAFGAFPAAITKERRKIFEFSDIILQNKTSLFYISNRFKSPPKFSNIQELRPYHIGGVRGYSYIDKFKKVGIDLSLVGSDIQNLKMLTRNRIDFIIADDLVGWHLVKNNFRSQRTSFGALAAPFIKGNSHLMISPIYPNSKLLQQRFNLALMRIKKRGVISNILKKHHLSYQQLESGIIK